MFRFASAALAAGLLIAGCASITRGITSQISFTSNPTGAEVQTTLGHRCTTPCGVSVQRKDEFTVTFTKQGYQTVSVQVLM